MAETHIFQWTTTYPDGSEGVIGAVLPGVGHVPLYARTPHMAAQMQPYAVEHGKRSNQRVWLRTWLTYEDSDPIEPTKKENVDV